jgi:5-methylcytosine-specific restriction endonuclease McrA
MACQKCRSDWVTRKGKDTVSCPECCKQQRAKARREGRLPASEVKVCKRCGEQFEAVGGNAIARSTKCRECVQAGLASRVRQKRYQARVKAGLKIPGKRAAKSLPRECSWCHKSLTTPNQRKYCSNRCFVDARKAGQQKWDRRGQIESVWHRGGKWAAAPSKKIIGEMENAFNKFVADMNSFRLIHEMQGFMYRSLYPRKSDVSCKTCGKMIGESSRAYCSVECWQQHEVEMPCRKCGGPSIAKAGRKSAVCVSCKERARRVTNSLAKQRYGRNHRQRARYHGVKHVAFPVRSIYERDGYKCQLCGDKTLLKVTYRKRDTKIHPRSPTIDHIVPMCKGGNHEPANCQTACFICNSRKSGKGGGQTRLALT